MSLELKGRNAIVTGGSRGIGAQIALDLAKAGASVLITYTSPNSQSKAEAVVEQINALGNGAKGFLVKADSGDAQIGETVKKAVGEVWGCEAKIHVLCHNAGVSHNANLEDMTMEEYDTQMNVNVRGVLFLTKALLPMLATGEKGRGASIIALSSVSARAGFPTQTIYAASKAAIEGAVRVWGHELTPKGITANCINPGPVKTDMFLGTTPEFQKTATKAMPYADPSEISDIVMFLASDKSRWVTGSVVSANGGGLLH